MVVGRRDAIRHQTEREVRSEIKLEYGLSGVIQLSSRRYSGWQ
jgi:hypothetical protein